MSYDEFRLCKGCPIKGARHFDSDGYWCCAHPDAVKHQYPFDPNEYTNETPERIQFLRELHEERDPVEDPIPFVYMKTCPVNHWRRTIEGGQIPKGQTELVTDAERMI